MTELARSHRVLVAIGIPVCALGLQWALWSHIQPFVWFFFFPAVFLSARLTGFSGGVLSTLVSIAAVWLFFMDPGALGRPTSHYLSMGVFLVTGILVADAFERHELTRARTAAMIREAEAANDKRQIERSADRLRRLAETVERIAEARDLAGLFGTVRRAARELTGADGVTLVLREDGFCRYVDEDAIAPLWKGQRFPMDACISGWVMLHRQVAVISDVREDERIPQDAYRPTFVKSLSMVPVGRSDPRGAVGCYWATPHTATPGEVELQQALADAMSVGLANLDLYQRHEAARAAAEATAEALRRSNDELQDAQRLAGIGSWTWSLAADEHTWSAEVFRIYGRDPELGPARYPEVREYFSPESWRAITDSVESALATGRPYELDAEVVQPSGDRRWVTIRGEAFRTGDGTVVALHGSVQDITQRKAQEEALRDLNATLERRVEERTASLSAAVEDLDAFAYAVSHDLRAPLRALMAYAEILQQEYPEDLPEDARTCLSNIASAARRMGALIDGLLSLSRSTRGDLRPEDVDLSDVAVRLLAELARSEPDRSVDVHVEPDLRAFADVRLIESVMSNLLGNAWKYTARTPGARIRVERGSVDGVEGITVSDNGAGFSMEHAARLFQPFQRLHRQDEFPGIGIGLANVRRVIRNAGGEIRATGVPGRGATFCFSLPPAPPRDPAPGSTPPGDPSVRPGGAI